MHIYDPERFPPSRPGARMQANATVDDYRRLQKRIGTERTVIVQPAAYGTDNRVTLDGIARLGNALGVAVVQQRQASLRLQQTRDRVMVEVLNAATPFTVSPNNPNEKIRTVERRSDYGFTIGGPVVLPKLYNGTDKTFFFGDFNVTLASNGNLYNQLTPTDLERAGDFSQTLSGGKVTPIYDPFGPAPARTPFPDNIIPVSRIDSAAAAISVLLPKTNQFDASGQPLAFNNYAVTRTTLSDVQSFDVRVDHQFSPANSVFIRHSFQDTDAVIPSLFGLPLGGPPTSAGTTPLTEVR